MKPSQKFPLRTLLELSHARLDDAARKLGQLLASEHASAQKLELLVRYREEYRSRFVEAAQGGLSPEVWRNYQSFLGKLEEAIAQQQSALMQSKQRTVDGQTAWLTQRTKAKAFDTLSDRHNVQERRVDAKREQRQTDEHASKSFHNAKQQ